MLHKINKKGGWYMIQETGLSLVKKRQGWRVIMIEVEGRKSAWSKRNEQLYNIVFPRLRDAREHVEALLSVDPLPSEYELLPMSRLTKNGPGKYKVSCGPGREAHIHRGHDGYWECDYVGINRGSSRHCSLWHLRASLCDLA